MTKPARFIASALAVLAAALPAPAQEWTRFRGPNGTGVSEAKGIPTTWTEKDFRWRVPIPGESHSQPVIWGDKLFLLSAMPDGKERMILCLGKQDGKELWSKKYPLGTNAKNKLNSFASSTPAVDKDRVYATFVSSDEFLVKAWDHAGKELWGVNLGPFASQHGHAASPVVHEDRLIVTNDQDAESFIVALEAKSGRTVWKSPRRAQRQGTAYATPTILERKGLPTQILTTSQAHGISSLDFKTGQLLWEAKVFDKRAVSSPVVVGDLVYGTCGSGGGGIYLSAVKLGGRGDVTSSHVAFKVTEGAPYVPTPVAIENRLYWVNDGGIATCIEASTGRIVYSQRVAEKLVVYGSPVANEGRIFSATSDGRMIVLAASDEYRVLATNPLGEGSHSTPCFDGDRMYIKTFKHLVCLGGK